MPKSSEQALLPDADSEPISTNPELPLAYKNQAKLVSETTLLLKSVCIMALTVIGTLALVAVLRSTSGYITYIEVRLPLPVSQNIF